MFDVSLGWRQGVSGGGSEWRSRKEKLWGLAEEYGERARPSISLFSHKESEISEASYGKN